MRKIDCSTELIVCEGGRMVSSIALFLIDLECFSVSFQTARRFSTNLASVRFELYLRSADDSFGRIILPTQQHPQRE